MPDRMIKLFMEMVTIDSESGNEEQMMQFLEKYFASTFHAKIHRDSYGNFIAKLPAKQSKQRKPIMLSCHADTVKPGVGIEPGLVQGVISSRGDTILGADDKAGIAEVIEALIRADSHPPIEFVVSRQEEVGLTGVKNLDFSLLESEIGFLMDGDVLDCIVIGGPTYVAIDVEITGKGAHAGMEPEKGISAIQAAARAITRLRLGRLDKDTTANIGTISGGLVRNGVPDKVVFAAECRSLNHQKAIDLAEGMRSIILSEVNQFGARAEVRTTILCDAVSIPETSPVVKIASRAIQSVGLEPKAVFITGFTDASIYNNKGIQTAVLGIGAQNEHSTNEKIAVADMEKAVRMLLYILKDLA
ncbi:MAG: M20/M25/M40 family metallo-hydrolase [Candidatus Zhuqueibacterota bacterium]